MLPGKRILWSKVVFPDAYYMPEHIQGSEKARRKEHYHSFDKSLVTGEQVLEKAQLVPKAISCLLPALLISSPLSSPVPVFSKLLLVRRYPF